MRQDLLASSSLAVRTESLPKNASQKPRFDLLHEVTFVNVYVNALQVRG